jgi:thymidylate kinase
MAIVCFEGLNGVGKTTQARALLARLRDEYPDRGVHLLQDPGVHEQHSAHLQLRPLARFADWGNPMTRMMLYMAARCELITTVRHYVAVGDIVVLDRYSASFYAYGEDAFEQAAGTREYREKFGDYSGRENITALLRICNSFVPDITIVLLADVELAIERWHQVSGDRPDVFEQEGRRRMEQLDACYRRMLAVRAEYPYLGEDCVAIEFGPHKRAEQLSRELWNEVLEHRICRLCCV